MYSMNSSDSQHRLPRLPVAEDTCGPRRRSGLSITFHIVLEVVQAWAFLGVANEQIEEIDIQVVVNVDFDSRIAVGLVLDVAGIGEVDLVV